MKIGFHNYELNKELYLESEKNLIIVYGKNGVGKTTLSRSSDLDSKYVFNENFIFSNIYNINDDGASQTVKTKERFSGLWIGEDIVKQRRIITNISLLEKQNNENYDKILLQITNFLQKNGIPFKLDDKVKLLKIDDFSIDLSNYDELCKEYYNLYIYDTNIKNDDECKKQIVYYKQNGLYNMLITFLKESNILANIILKEKNDALTNVNIKINELIENKKLLEEVEKIYKDNEISANIKDKIEDWYKIHINRESCLFCGNTNIKAALGQWKKVFNDRNIINKKNIIKEISSTVDTCEKILKEKSFEQVDKEIITIVVGIKVKLLEYTEKIKNNNFENIVIEESIEKRELLENNKIVENIINFAMNKIKDKLSFYYNVNLYLIDLKKRHNTLSDKLMEESGVNIAKSISEKFIALGLNKDISITVDKRSIPHKFIYSIKGHDNINELSDGQKHKVALSIFVDYLEKQDLENKTIVIDDPVVSLDITGYILFKQYIISNLIANHFKDSTKLIILTHDITYLYIQLSNIFENEEMRDITEIFKISSTCIKPIPLEFIKTDDITLFKALIDDLSNLKELRILRSIFIKIFRIMLDLKQRFYGMVSLDKLNIDKLPYDNEIKKTIQNYSNYFDEIGRKNTPTDEQIGIAFRYLYEISIIFGFDGFIDIAHVEKAERLICDNVEGENISDLFSIINSLQIFLNESSNNEMKDYINHTRNSYTRNIIGLSLDDYYEKKDLADQG